MHSELLSARLSQLSPFTLIAATACFPVVCVVVLYLYQTPSSWKDKRRKNLPPGPKGLPFVGNMFDLADTTKVRDKVVEWHQKYGDVVYTKIGGTDYIWLSSPRAIKDLMDKKSAIYSSRIPAPMAQDVASGGKRQLFMQYGPQWRSIRKHSHALLNATVAVKYQSIQDYESKQLMTELLDTPEDFYMHNRRYSASVIMLVTYGYRLPKWSHPLVKQIYDIINNFTDITAPGAHAVDSFPSLKALPEWMLGNWRTLGKKVFEHDSKVYLDLWNTLKKEVDEGTAKECFCKDFYTSNPYQKGIDDLQAAYACGGLIEAGSETTGTTLNNFIMAMLQFPEAAKKAQEEIDKVVGSDRMPTWEDEKDLPYVRALVKEVLRWRPVSQFGMPHCNSDDDWYRGYFIPKGSVVMLSWWAIHMDPALYPSPETFNPARYLNKPLSAAEYLTASDPYSRDHFTYGAGRRACPGVHVAESSLYINIVRTLWGFDILKELDGDGHAVEPNAKLVPGFLTVPEPFNARFVVRSEGRGRIIRETFAKAEREGIKVVR